MQDEGQEWAAIPGAWNIFENSSGWRVTVDTARLPSRWDGEDKLQFCNRVVRALNNEFRRGDSGGQP